ncbi:MAG TPA: helix-turn-helix domain-containing protein [Candidatus Gallimonas gallistercoris]|uniref:Helix-turn-helix domain-containing protein n=1 Tax=Candidatus Gallimonas gallistercoris TaxID=2838602 RepID=A0A9D2H1D8_9FIRM|nr:helix-turn-helix domain-containing protein [Candidatus Gallimonas gallistercoris]
MNTLGQRIAYFRKQKGLTQEALAELCSVSAQAVSKWENDLTAPDISLLPRLAELFGITVDELLGVKKDAAVAVDPAHVDFGKLMLRIRILSEDGDKVNINLPFALVEVFLKDGKLPFSADGAAGEAMKSIDFAKLSELVHAGVLGKLVDIESSDGDVIEIWVE